MADVRSLEHPTLKVPYEILNKRFRSAQKVHIEVISTLVVLSIHTQLHIGSGQGGVPCDW